MINISIDISRKKKYNAIVKRNLTHQFQILSNSTLKLLKFHFPPISSSSSLYPLFFPYLNLPYFLPNIPSPFANFFTNSSLPSFFFFFSSPIFPRPFLHLSLPNYNITHTYVRNGGSLFSDVQAFWGSCSRLIEFIRSSASAL